MMVPTLLLLGSESPPGFRERIEAVDAAFSDSTIRILDGQGHAANITAPDLLATEILAFTEA
jgi:pimeloyl-ACP methyl ester carboxylesterase